VFKGDDPNRLRGLDFELARQRLAALNIVKDLRTLGQLRSVGLHKLSGDRRGQWAMNVNGRWRVCFRFHDGDAFDVEITDYHKG
jgi:toxin HigB-1